MLSPSLALSDLKFAVRHMGLRASIDDLTENGVVLAAAQPSVEPVTDAPVPSHAGAIPLRLQAGRDQAPPLSPDRAKSSRSRSGSTHAWPSSCGSYAFAARRVARPA